ncbi:hypothetical protein AOLI_G00269740 [Acnodon oligacanthus]
MHTSSKWSCSRWKRKKGKRVHRFSVVAAGFIFNVTGLKNNLIKKGGVRRPEGPDSLESNPVRCVSDAQPQHKAVSVLPIPKPRPSKGPFVRWNCLEV